MKINKTGRVKKMLYRLSYSSDFKIKTKSVFKKNLLISIGSLVP